MVLLTIISRMKYVVYWRAKVEQQNVVPVLPPDHANASIYTS